MNPITSAVTAVATGDTASAPAPSKAATGVDKNMFLQLLVAQMRHQDPLHPQDGTQFLAQLAQFQQLEAGLNSVQELAAIRMDLDKIANIKTTTGESNV